MRDKGVCAIVTKENVSDMKLLSIGNSFSQDAHKCLHKLAVANVPEDRRSIEVRGRVYRCSVDTDRKGDPMATGQHAGI